MMMIWDFKREGDALFQHLQGKLGPRVNSRRGYESAKAGVQIPALSNRGYGIGYCTPLFDIVCLAVLSK